MGALQVGQAALSALSQLLVLIAIARTRDDGIALIIVCLAKPVYNLLMSEEFFTRREYTLVHSCRRSAHCSRSVFCLRPRQGCRAYELHVEDCHGPILCEGDCFICSWRFSRCWCVLSLPYRPLRLTVTILEYEKGRLALHGMVDREPYMLRADESVINDALTEILNHIPLVRRSCRSLFTGH